MKNYLFSLLLPTILISCDSKLSDPQAIVDKTIEVSGGAKYQKSVVEFDFRDRHYIARRDGGAFSYERIFEDTTGTVHDYVTNNGFRREINGEEVVVPDSMATKYTSSTNSVNYFALLPYGLNDPAVNKTFLGETEIEGKQYFKIKVTFSADGGGEDFEDEFLYWINQETFTMDYLAYSFEESDEVSFRFRVGYNPRIVNGIRVQDYVNYKPENNTLKVDQAEELYKAGKLIELSRIETENVTVE
ncbi:MAG TPA: hypothetical protein PKJ63_08130 [Cyclobacteriaceae bacterium]|nr:hypothetical protein [Cyclobacteriaceae bacterium]